VYSKAKYERNRMVEKRRKERKKKNSETKSVGEERGM